MWEAYGLDNEDILWSCIAFNGGIAGQQSAPCGAVSASTVCVGLRHRWPLADKQRAKQERLDAREDASQLVRSFIERFGAITCRDLVGVDFSKPEAYRAFQESGISKDKCDKYVEFVIEKLYELDEKRSIARVPQKVVLYTRPGCPFCAQARQDLEERGVSYEEVSIAGNPKAVEEVMRLSSGAGIVPILVSGDEVKVGFGGG
jgi:C_GCAxxG_C_C family probable redox protein